MYLTLRKIILVGAHVLLFPITLGATLVFAIIQAIRFEMKWDGSFIDYIDTIFGCICGVFEGIPGAIKIWIDICKAKTEDEVDDIIEKVQEDFEKVQEDFEKIEWDL